MSNLRPGRGRVVSACPLPGGLAYALLRAKGLLMGRRRRRAEGASPHDTGARSTTSAGLSNLTMQRPVSLCDSRSQGQKKFPRTLEQAHCYGMLRAADCVYESDHHALVYVWHGQTVREDRVGAATTLVRQALDLRASVSAARFEFVSLQFVPRR